MLASLYVGINISQNWIQSIIIHSLGFFYWFLKALLFILEKEEEHSNYIIYIYIDLSVWKLLFAMCFTLLVEGIIFRSEEKERRNAFYSHYFNMKRNTLLKTILLQMPVGVLLIKNGISLYNPVLLEIFDIPNLINSPEDIKSMVYILICVSMYNVDKSEIIIYRINQR